ncbi:MAG TPA: hypothetical protein VFV68_13655, partial [Agriterribacter sp.]|nr:hypothetical protein [Agriterribacter sp.]
MKKSLVKLGTCFLIVLFFSCDEKKSIPSRSAINAINLKRGELISCGPSGSQFGMVEFEFSGSQNVKKDFNLAIALLHS